MNTGAADGPSAAELRGLLGDLLERWDQGPEEARMRREDRPSPGQLLAVHALAAHTHRLGHAVATLVDNGLQFESSATVRAAFECGLTAQWMAQYGHDSFLAYMRESNRQNVNLHKTLRDLSKDVPLSSADAIARLIDEQVMFSSTAGDESAKSFAALCRDFELTAFYYSGYRTLSGLTHAGAMVTSAYVESADPIALRLTPETSGDGRLWLVTTCCALIWAARAADMLSADQPRREFLRDAAGTIGIVAEPPLTKKAQDARDAHRAGRD